MLEQPVVDMSVEENAGTRRFRLVLADDHADILGEVASLLEFDFDVLCTVGEGTALVDAASELRPDAVISDIQMPRLGGIEAGEQILREGSCPAIVVLTMYNDPNLVEKAMAAGIRGYVLKVDASEELIPAVHAVLRGARYISRSVSAL
jgi:DNA-binding NarL/FixJ family response regulator